MIVVMNEPIKSCEFGEEKSIADLQSEAEALGAAIEAADAVFVDSGAELDRMAREAYDRLRAEFGIIEDLAKDVIETIRSIILMSPRIRHPRIRPPRIREGFPQLWVVPQLAGRSAPERGNKWRRIYRDIVALKKEQRLTRRPLPIRARSLAGRAPELATHHSSGMSQVRALPRPAPLTNWQRTLCHSIGTQNGDGK